MTLYPTLEVQRKLHGDRMIITCEGESDDYTVHVLLEAIQTTIGEGYHHITVDLTAVEYLDATTLGVLVGGHVRCREKDGKFNVVVTDSRIRSIFEIIGLNNVFDIHPSRELAMTPVPA